MPTKARKKRERAEQLRKAMLSDPPAYIKTRINARRASGEETWSSELLAPLEDPRTRLRGGLVEGDQTGDLGVRSDVMRKNRNSANEERSDKRKQDAAVLKKKYQSTWGDRKTAKVIAAKECLSVRTVQKYFRDFP